MTPTLHFTCIGGAVIDRKYRAAAPLRAGTSNPAAGAVSFGGVARNVAENLARLGNPVAFASVVGDDAAGQGLLAHLAGLGVDISGVLTRAGRRTAEYAALLEPDGSLAVAVADMGLLDELYNAVSGALAAARPAPGRWLFADCNAPAGALAGIVTSARERGLSLALDAISAPKAARLPADLTGVGCLCLNSDEAVAVLGGAGTPQDMVLNLAARGAARVVLTMGAQGMLVTQRTADVREHRWNISHVPAAAGEVRDVTGAGDANIAGLLHGLARGWPLTQAAHLGAHLAARTVAVMESVDPALSPETAAAFMALVKAERV